MPAATLPISPCPTPGAALAQTGQTIMDRHDCGTCGFVLPRAFPLPRSERAKQPCKPLSIAQHKEAGSGASSHLLPSSGCIENSSWTPSWASRQVAGTQPCSSDVLTNHQPGNKTAGGSAKGTHQPKTTSLLTSHESGGLCPLRAATWEAGVTPKQQSQAPSERERTQQQGRIAAERYPNVQLPPHGHKKWDNSEVNDSSHLICFLFFFFSFMVHFLSVWVSKSSLISRDEYTVCKSITDSCCALAFFTFVKTANFKSYEQMQD